MRSLGFYSHKGGKAAGGLSKVKHHLKYLEWGKARPNQPRAFDQEHDLADKRAFLERLRARPERGVIAHKLVFSLSQDERDKLGIDLRTLVRETMAEWAGARGRRLDWIAFEHHEEGHPHVHVVVAGRDAAGKEVAIFPKDLALLRDLSEREKERQYELTRASGLTREDREALAPPKPNGCAGRP